MRRVLTADAALIPNYVVTETEHNKTHPFIRPKGFPLHSPLKDNAGNDTMIIGPFHLKENDSE